jgi:hypothetical protein
MGQARRSEGVSMTSGLPPMNRHSLWQVSKAPIVDTLKPLDHLVVAVWLTIQGARREGLRHLEEV